MRKVLGHGSRGGSPGEDSTLSRDLFRRETGVERWVRGEKGKPVPPYENSLPPTHSNVGTPLILKVGAVVEDFENIAIGNGKNAKIFYPSGRVSGEMLLYWAASSHNILWGIRSALGRVMGILLNKKKKKKNLDEISWGAGSLFPRSENIFAAYRQKEERGSSSCAGAHWAGGGKITFSILKARYFEKRPGNRTVADLLERRNRRDFRHRWLGKK